ncbi:hypothetical protein HDU67_003598 [Dinochytrium kinnereticum]|nr:hypothetical protein HDU67_003598 [Dinochytrium kinnereticum]
MIDINSFLHRSAHAIPQTQDDLKLIRALIQKLNSLLLYGYAVPRRTVFLAVDGPAPWAKLVQQRSRRRGVCDKRLTTTLGAYFNRLQFTPGTPFMNRLDAYLAGYAHVLMDKIPTLQEVVISGSRVAGEGEEKILSRLRNLTGEPKRGTETVGILGIDSDMLLQPYYLTSSQTNHDVTVLHWMDKVAFRPSDMFRSLYGDGEAVAIASETVNSVTRFPRRGEGPNLSAYLSMRPATPSTTSPVTGSMPPTLPGDLGTAILMVCGNDTFPGLRRYTPPHLNPDLDDPVRSMAHPPSNLDQVRDVISASLSVLTVPGPDGVFRRLVDEVERKVDVAVLRDILIALGGTGESSSRGGEEEKRKRKAEYWLRSLAWMVGSAVEGRCVDYRWVHSRKSLETQKVESAWQVSVDDVLWWIQEGGGKTWEEVERKAAEVASWKGFEGKKALSPEMCAVALLPHASRDLVHPKLHTHLEEYDTFCESIRSRYFNSSSIQVALMTEALTTLDESTHPLQHEIIQSAPIIPNDISLRRVTPRAAAFWYHFPTTMTTTVTRNDLDWKPYEFSGEVFGNVDLVRRAFGAKWKRREGGGGGGSFSGILPSANVSSGGGWKRREGGPPRDGGASRSSGGSSVRDEGGSGRGGGSSRGAGGGAEGQWR